MTPEQVHEVERRLLAGETLAAVAEALAVSRKTIERAFAAAHGTTPARWARERGVGPRGPSPVVAFRLLAADHARLTAAAEKDGVELGAWARWAVVRALSVRAIVQQAKGRRRG